MKIDTVRNVKEEMFEMMSVWTADQADWLDLDAPTHDPWVRITGKSRPSRETSGMALGIVEIAPEAFHLAVRIQRQRPETRFWLSQMRKRTYGGLNVQYIGRVLKHDGPSRTSAAFYQRRQRPLPIGCSISDDDPDHSAGTLGCFARLRESPKVTCLVTNNHVIADENGNKLGQPLLQPGTLDEGIRPSDVIGELYKYVKLKRGINYVDAALGRLHDGVPYEPRHVGNLGRLAGIRPSTELKLREPLFKVGRSTGQTAGVLSAFELDNLEVEYATGVFRFDDQIEIEGQGTDPFSDGGDSGALIVSRNRRAVGLLFAGSDEGGANGQGLTYANPIERVLQELDVELER